MVINENKVLELFKDLPFQIDGIGFFLDVDNKKIVAKQECNEYVPIGIDDRCNAGYIRYNGANRFTKIQKIVACSTVYTSYNELVLVAGFVDTNLVKLQQSILSIFVSNDDIELKSISFDKDEIEKLEIITKNNLNLVRVVFSFTEIISQDNCIYDDRCC